MSLLDQCMEIANPCGKGASRPGCGRRQLPVQCFLERKGVLRPQDIATEVWAYRAGKEPLNGGPFFPQDHPFAMAGVDEGVVREDQQLLRDGSKDLSEGFG